MKWTSKSCGHSEGDIKLMSNKFLFFPITIDCTTKWLEKASWKVRFEYSHDSYGWKWKAIEWLE
jgi:hypothetical protein